MVYCCAGSAFPSNAQISKERKTFRAKSLPANRPRALTLPLNDEYDTRNQVNRSHKNILSSIIKKIKTVQQQTFAQKESLLITRLPYEIRMLIWQSLLCDHHLHLVRAPKRLLAIRCDEEESSGDCGHRCWGYSTISVRFGPRAAGYYTGKKDDAQCEHANLLSVLMTCRFIYSETIDLLYSGNKFEFNSPDTILSLSQTILPSRLNLPRVVRLEYSFPRFLYILPKSDAIPPPRGMLSDPDIMIENPNLVAPFDARTWQQACTVLANLASLRELYIHLSGAPLNDNPELVPYNNIKQILGSLMHIRQPRLQVFEVSVPWKEDPGTTYDTNGAPFRLKHVVFDVVGTCVSFDAFFDAIERAIGQKLRTHNVTAKLLGFAWMQAAELEYTMLLMSGRNTPYKEIFKALFYRVLFMAGIEDPRSFATDEERDMCQAGYSQLELRPGCREMMEKLKDNGFTIWCLTTGDTERVGGYFKRAGYDMPADKLVSCHEFLPRDSTPSGAALLAAMKPSMESYKPMLDKFSPEDQKWFAAAHMWDVSAAVKAGFRGAYCSIYEKESCIEIFDTEMAVIADTLPEMADKMIALSSNI